MYKVYNVEFIERDITKYAAQSPGDIIMISNGVRYDVNSRSSGFIIHILKSIIGLENPFIMDIGCGDGKSTSNSYDALHTFEHPRGFILDSLSYLLDKAISIYNGFENIKIVENRITPDNVVSILRQNKIPLDDLFLTIDIDGLDYLILEKILEEYSPVAICMEINEKIPPPIKFYLKYSGNDFVWDGSHFYGCSIQSAYDLCYRFGYEPICLEWNNIHFIKREYVENISDIKPIDQIYKEGYSQREGRESIFYYNRNVDSWLSGNVEDTIDNIKCYFQQYKNMYEINT